MQEKLLAYRLLVSEQMLAQGLSNVGDSRRMERFFGKLLRGAQRSAVPCISCDHLRRDCITPPIVCQVGKHAGIDLLISPAHHQPSRA